MDACLSTPLGLLSTSYWGATGSWHSSQIFCNTTFATRPIVLRRAALLGLRAILVIHQAIICGLKGNAHENRRYGKGDFLEQIRFPFF
jgi:hypothetical protein